MCNAAENAATKRTAYEARRCYITPHPTIYLVLELEANQLKNDRVIEWAPF